MALCGFCDSNWYIYEPISEEDGLVIFGHGYCSLQELKDDFEKTFNRLANGVDDRLALKELRLYLRFWVEAMTVGGSGWKKIRQLNRIGQMRHYLSDGNIPISWQHQYSEELYKMGWCRPKNQVIRTKSRKIVDDSKYSWYKDIREMPDE